MVRIFVGGLLSLLSVNVLALDIDHCPLPQNIKNNYGIYTASTVSRKGQWVGTTSAQRVKGSDRYSAELAETFNGALFYSTEKDGINRGVLSRCMYTNAKGEKLDLYYRPDVRPELVVKLLDVKNWKLQSDSRTGLQTYVCSNKQQGGCVFAVVE